MKIKVRAGNRVVVELVNSQYASIDLVVANVLKRLPNTQVIWFNFGNGKLKGFVVEENIPILEIMKLYKGPCLLN
ncbi:MAG TPA: hypothetical protein V6D25_29580 [Leptolyngbyaceae cyanobacterium]